MGTWNIAINGNDTFLDVYQRFFGLYNEGQNPVDISKQIQEEYEDVFNDYDDKHPGLFGFALAQWETKSLDPVIFKQVKDIIEKGEDIEVWKEHGVDEKTLQKRQAALDKFLQKISAEKEKPKRRVRDKFEFHQVELVKVAAPDNKKVFEASEQFTNGVYIQTGSRIGWENGGGAVFYFTAQDKLLSVRWLDSQTLEVTHSKDIVFTKKDEKFYFCGDQGKVIYIPI
jgi:hypothetical protein